MADEPKTEETEVPKEETEVPKEENEVPKDETEVPKDETEVPKEENDVPKDETEVPKEENEVPKDETEVPKEENEATKDETEVPKEEIEVSKKETEVPEDGSKSKAKKPSFPKRYVLILMIFLGFAVQYALRVNLNVAITAMCNNHTTYKNGFTTTKPAEFHWSSKLQGTVLGSFFYGYIVLQIPGGYLALKYGGTKVFGWAVFFGSLLTLLTPLAARLSVVALIALRILEGVFLGVLFPCNHDILRKWAPASEKTRLFAIAVAGCPIGTIITMPLSGLLTKYGPDGWASVFYCFGAIGLCWSFIWMLVIHPNPEVHPTISEEEKTYIRNQTTGNNPAKTGPVPWLSIITSVPVWAVIVANFTADWGLYTILICIPKYFVEVLNFDIAKTGFVASLPYVVKAFVGPTGGLIVDMMIKNGMSVRNARRLIFSIGCTVAAIFILAVGYSPMPAMAIAFLCIGVGITGVNATGYAVNLLDIAPKFAGVIMGITNVFGSLPGFLSPQIVGIITVNKTAAEWRVVFWITFLVYMAGVLIFALCVSGDEQKWAMSPEQLEKLEKEKEEKKPEEETKDEADEAKEADESKQPEDAEEKQEETKTDEKAPEGDESEKKGEENGEEKEKTEGEDEQEKKDDDDGGGGGEGGEEEKKDDTEGGQEQKDGDGTEEKKADDI